MSIETGVRIAWILPKPAIVGGSLALNWLWIAVGIWLAKLGALWAVLLSLCVLGVLQHRMALQGHEAAHFLLSRNRRLNEILGNILCMYPIGTTIAAYRRWHFVHHRALGSEEDSERAFKGGWKYTLPLTPRRLGVLFAGDLIGMGSAEVLRLQWILRPRGWDALGLAMFWVLAVLVCWALDALWIIPLWVLALFTSFWAAFRIRAVSEHAGVAGTHRFHAPLWARYVFFPYHTWMHDEHHRCPSVPWWNLPLVRGDDRPTTSLFDVLDPDRSKHGA